MRTVSHTRVGVRFRWRANCESGSVLRIARFRNVAVFPEPFSFANNEAKGRLRAIVNWPGKGGCRSGTVTWEARR
jgi:hypothetical protein